MARNFKKAPTAENCTRFKGKIFLTAALVLIFSQIRCLADTIFFKNGKEEKGIVVEEYIDRVTFSTINGEKHILKSDITDILYDMPVQNLVKLGDFHKEKGNIERAYSYYYKAYKTDPSYKPALDRYVQTSSQILKMPYNQLEQKIRKQKDIMQASRGLIKTQQKLSFANAQKVKNILGIELISKNEKPYVNKIYTDSLGYDAGIREGDYIISVSNRLTGYMELKAVYSLILEAVDNSIKLIIERPQNFLLDNKEDYSKGGVASLGFFLKITEKGLTITKVLAGSIADTYGVMKSDVISAIGTNPTRYIPLKKAVALLESFDKEVPLIIQRELIIWPGSK